VVAHPSPLLSRARLCVCVSLPEELFSLPLRGGDPDGGVGGEREKDSRERIVVKGKEVEEKQGVKGKEVEEKQELKEEDEEEEEEEKF